MRTLLLSTFVFAAVTLTTHQNASAAEDFYKGKTIDVNVGFGPGGGYDIYARALVQFFPGHIPGKPTLIVRNMPGAGSLRLVNYLYSVAPKDGTSIGTFDPGLLISPLLEPERVKSDLSRLSWIGSIVQVANICLTDYKSPIKKWDDLFKYPSSFGATGTSDRRYGDLATIKNMFGAKMQIVSGYHGTAEIYLAMERGEISGTANGYASLIATGADLSKLNMIVQLATEKHPALPDVPLLIDKATSDKQRAALRLLFAPNLAGRPFAAPPEVSKERVQILRDAFDATMKDPEFLEFATKSKLELGPVTGKDIEALLGEIYRSPSDVVSLAAAAKK